MRITLVTEGDPARISGGFLYQRRVAERAGEHGAALRMVSVPARRFPLALIDGPRVLRRARRDADVVVVDSLASNTLGPWIALGLVRRPMVGSVHQRLGGTDLHPLRQRIQRRFDRWAYRRCRHVIVPSELLAGQLREDGLAADALHVVPPGRDVPEADGGAAGAAELREGRQVAVLCIANWVERKGVLSLLDAVAALDDDMATVHLVGDEDLDPAYRDRVLARIAAVDLVDRVHRHGVVPPARVPAWMDAADVFVLASTEEPYGMVYAEAMAAGLPVLGWRAGNLPNMITDGVEGHLVATGDIPALTAAIAALAADPARRAAMGAAGRTRADSFPMWDDTAAAFYAVCAAAAAAADTE